MITRENYLDYIRHGLGAPVIKLEVEQFLTELLLQAFEEMKHYITDKCALSLPFQNQINMSQYKVASVEDVWRGQNNVSPVTYSGLGYYKMIPGQGMSGMVSDYANALRIRSNLATISTDMDFFYEKPTQRLYVYANQSPPSTITIIYQPEYETPEDIWEPYWQDQLKQMALSWARISIGEIRSKYTRSGALWNINGESILQRGLADLATQRQYLRANRNLSASLD